VDKRGRLLRAVRATYLEMLEKSDDLYHLCASVDVALDRLTHPLCDWAHLAPNCSVPAYVKAAFRCARSR
jgi:hypothetical protein